MKSPIDKILKVRKPNPKHRIINEIANRWSPRFFSAEPVPREHLDTMFEAARWAPSAHNYQPWQYFFALKGTTTYDKLLSTLNNYNQSWAQTAPVLILACAITKAGGKVNRFAVYDLGASVISFILQAQSLGYYSRQMGLFDKEKIREYFRLKKELDPFVVIALGKIGNYTNASKEIIETELDPRPRKQNIVGKLE